MLKQIHRNIQCVCCLIDLSRVNFFEREVKYTEFCGVHRFDL